MKKLLIIFLVIILSVLGYFGWQKYADRTAQPENDATILIKNTAQESTTEENNSDMNASLDNQFPTEILRSEPGSFRDVSGKNCENECRDFSAANELTYCQEVCGLKPPVKDNQECEALKNLEHDYCLKNQAVTKKDFSLCEKIADPNIRKTCQNRVTEDILDQ